MEICCCALFIPKPATALTSRMWTARRKALSQWRGFCRTGRGLQCTSMRFQAPHLSFLRFPSLRVLTLPLRIQVIRKNLAMRPTAPFCFVTILSATLNTKSRTVSLPSFRETNLIITTLIHGTPLLLPVGMECTTLQLSKGRGMQWPCPCPYCHTTPELKPKTLR